MGMSRSSRARIAAEASRSLFVPAGECLALTRPQGARCLAPRGLIHQGMLLLWGLAMRECLARRARGQRPGWLLTQMTQLFSRALEVRGATRPTARMDRS